MSTGEAAIKMPDKPPTMNMLTKDIAYSIGGSRRMAPPHRVPIQLNTLTPEGRAMNTVLTMKAMPMIGFKPDTNIWWPQTMKPKPMIEIMLMIMARSVSYTHLTLPT